jgi:hypothetical protein
MQRDEMQILKKELQEKQKQLHKVAIEIMHQIVPETTIYCLLFLFLSF